MSGEPVKRAIYLNGVDTGLGAFSRNGAVAIMVNLLKRRGHLHVTEERVWSGYSTSKGRVDFTWPVTQ